MNEHAKDPNHGRNTFFLWLEYHYNSAWFWSRYYWSFFSERLAKTGWTMLFALLFLYFVYTLCFVHESQRISNESAKIGAFLMLLFMLLSSLRNSKYYQQI